MLSIETLPSATHEMVVKASDPDIGLTAFLAIHSTALGPAAGGLRMKTYRDEDEALADALALSKAMSYKAAAADIPLGGGKSVLVGNPYTDKTAEKLHAFGQALNSLEGRYHVAEDMGIAPDDIAVIGETSPYVCGLNQGQFASGDPSPVTARGVFNAVKLSAKHRFGSENLTGRIVAVQGVGHVGGFLCQHLHDHGARLVICDTQPELCAEIKEKTGAGIVAIDEIYAQDVDIFAPCAIGSTVNATTIPQLKAKIVAGAANNQLAQPQDAERLLARNILYAPDYVANGAGIVNATAEILHIENRESWVNDKILALRHRLDEIFHLAAQEKVSPALIADRLALAILTQAQNEHA